jgi:Zn-dependent M28 family amino/carboxypeptidase
MGAPTRDNVIGWLPGAKTPERLVIVGGHYDSRTLNTYDGVSAAPGANDSGSQTSLVLEVARVLAGHTYDATLVFVAFAGEEQGLTGSTALATQIGTVFPGAKVVAMLNCDIVGGDNTVNDAQALQAFRLFSPGTPRETAPDTNGSPDDTSPSRGVMRAIGAWGAAYVPSMKILPQYREDRPGRGGDHEPFIDNSYPGVRFIEPTESLAHQHTPDDLFQYVTPAYTARVASVIGSVVASIARAPSSPTELAFDGAAFSWKAPSGGTDHYVFAARKTTSDLYGKRVRVSATTAKLSAIDLGVASGEYWVSVAAVDAKGHESLFAYPELRCTAGDQSCEIPPDALNITATQ